MVDLVGLVASRGAVAPRPQQLQFLLFERLRVLGGRHRPTHVGQHRQQVHRHGGDPGPAAIPRTDWSQLRRRPPPAPAPASSSPRCRRISARRRATRARTSGACRARCSDRCCAHSPCCCPRSSSSASYMVPLNRAGFTKLSTTSNGCPYCSCQSSLSRRNRAHHAGGEIRKYPALAQHQEPGVVRDQMQALEHLLPAPSYPAIAWRTLERCRLPAGQRYPATAPFGHVAQAAPGKPLEEVMNPSAVPFDPFVRSHQAPLPGVRSPLRCNSGAAQFNATTAYRPIMGCPVPLSRDRPAPQALTPFSAITQRL